MLSLLGVFIGILVIVVIFTAVDSLKKEVNDSLSSIGSDVVYVHKWPWEGGWDYPWWKYFLRPQPSVSDAELLEKRLSLADNISYKVSFNRPVKYRNNSYEKGYINGIWLNYDKVTTIDITNGRYFTESEIRGGRSVCVIGHDVANNLFPNQDPIGSEIRIKGVKFEVIGVIKKSGEGLLGVGDDEKVFIPESKAKTMVDVNNWNVDQEVIIKPKAGVSSIELKDELTGVLRSIRKLKPAEENNFSLNEASMIKKNTDGILIVLNAIGWIIGGLALLVGVFGVTNIMFVSVKERTNIIGIQKALGAKRSYILWQFLIESMILTIIGGLFGIFVVFILTQILSAVSDFKMTLTFSNFLWGLGISTLSGIVSGIIPAYSASKLDPVEAIRSK